MSKLRLHTIIGSTRPGRVGPVFGQWFHQQALDHGGFEAELVDLADFSLPVFDEANLPVQQQYEHEHTKKWSASVQRADAFVFVIPEYNANLTPALYNALQFLWNEWSYKAASIVSYGFAAGGFRASQQLKILLTSFKAVPLLEQVAVPMFPQYIEDGHFAATEPQTKAAQQALDELLRWSKALLPLRNS